MISVRVCVCGCGCLCRLVLVSGGCDSRLHIYLRGPGETSFKAALKLPGHDGWVRSLAVHHVGGEGAAPELLIATASQDRSVEPT